MNREQLIKPNEITADIEFLKQYEWRSPSISAETRAHFLKWKKARIAELQKQFAKL